MSHESFGSNLGSSLSILIMMKSLRRGFGKALMQEREIISCILVVHLGQLHVMETVRVNNT